MKVGVFVIIKNENLYIRDFVEYYKNKGFANVILYDNNDELGEYPLQVILDYIDNNYVLYNNVRGLHPDDIPIHFKCMNDCFNTYKNIFDWILFVDCDEFIEFTEDNNINDYLSRSIFDDTNVILLNWLCYGDNNNLYYDKRPVWERMPNPAEPLDRIEINMQNKLGITAPYNYFTKSIVCCKKNIISIEFNSPHTCKAMTVKQKPIYRTNNGSRIYELYIMLTYNYDLAYIKHYMTLTATEFLYRRFGRRSDASDPNGFKKENGEAMFFGLNDHTPEKDKIFNNFFKNFK